jgi:alkanesulfonate monooxygenase SsuD/methylene tetrahydromethanopterin reductase-like flavin-dependent oxidoreductase (luciferase family)
VRHALYVPTFGEFADARTLAGLAADAESAGWDGFFTWDHMAMWWDRVVPVADTTVALTAVALATERMRIGPIVTPLPRRRPWKVAREMATLDHLSGGRMVLGVGLGSGEHEFEAFGEIPGLSARAAMLDEALDVVAGLWRGEPFSCSGRFFTLTNVVLRPVPVQQPRIPIWVAVSWPNPGPLRRAVRWDGAIAALAQPGDFNTPVAAVESIRRAAGAAHREAPFDIIVVNGNPQWDLAADVAEVATYEAAGLTWWAEDLTPWRFGGSAQPPWPLAAMRERVMAGPAGGPSVSRSRQR